MQAAPIPGKEVVFPAAVDGLHEFVDYAMPDLEFALGTTEEWLNDRFEWGFKKYGTPLQTFNGRCALQDAWEEAADLVQYLEQAMLELPKEERTLIFEVADLAREALLRLTALRCHKEAGIGG